jgi:hypothetical protein
MGLCGLSSGRAACDNEAGDSRGWTLTLKELLMKLNVAAALFQSERRGRNALTLFIALVISIGFAAGAASALDGIDLSNPAEESEESEEAGCAQLIQIKYPFLKCASGEIGLAEGDDNWESSRRIQVMSDWTEGDGYWGPDLNVPVE